MRAKIFSFVKISDESIVASVRIARFVSETLQIPITWDASVDDEQLDVLIIVNGAYAFAGSAVLEALGRAIRSAIQVIWIQNDYTVIPPKSDGDAESPFRKAFRLRAESGRCHVDYWTTCRDFSRAGMKSPNGRPLGLGSAYVNWNCLAVEDRPIRPWSGRQASESMIYYGSYRADRKTYFNRYFTLPKVPTVVSSPSRKFAEEYPDVTHESKLHELYDYLSHFGLGLYVEDRASHKSFHSPANRIYEMLSAGLPIVFQPEASRMLAQAGFETDEYEIWSDGLLSLERHMERREEILVEQRERWWPRALESRAELPVIVRKNWEHYL